MEKQDILNLLAEYIPEDNPRKWAKLSSTINYRRLNLLLLKEILQELRTINKTLLAARSTDT
jgi:hypothetical protein